MNIKSSDYNYCIRSGRQRFLIWNTMSDALISVDHNIYNALLKDDLFSLPEDVLKVLQDMGVLILSDRNELSELEEDLLLRSSGQDPHIFPIWKSQWQKDKQGIRNGDPMVRQDRMWWGYDGEVEDDIIEAKVIDKNRMYLKNPFGMRGVFYYEYKHVIS